MIRRWQDYLFYRKLKIVVTRRCIQKNQLIFSLLLLKEHAIYVNAPGVDFSTFIVN